MVFGKFCNQTMSISKISSNCFHNWRVCRRGDNHLSVTYPMNTFKATARRFSEQGQQLHIELSIFLAKKKKRKEKLDTKWAQLKCPIIPSFLKWRPTLTYCFITWVIKRTIWFSNHLSQETLSLNKHSISQEKWPRYLKNTRPLPKPQKKVVLFIIWWLLGMFNE